MVRAWHGRGMASVNQTRPHCVNQMGKTHFKPLAAQHGRGTAWARHAMCESALTGHYLQNGSTAHPPSYIPGNAYSPPCTSETISWITPLGITSRYFTEGINYESNSLYAFKQSMAVTPLMHTVTAFAQNYDTVFYKPWQTICSLIQGYKKKAGQTDRLRNLVFIQIFYFYFVKRA